MSYLIYKDKLPVSVIYAFVLNMISNVLFTPIQFTLQNNTLGLIDIFIVLITLIAFEVISFKHKLYPLFILMIPYTLWILFATFLQLTITWLN
jgi:tryptophan-rich sensory protein